MILNSQSISNDSGSFNDYRYQKALKQIGKLINVNRQIKLQSQKIKTDLITLHQKNQQLQQINIGLQNQVQKLRNEIESINHNYSQLQNFCKSVEFQQKQLLKNRQNQTITKMEMQNSYKTQIETLRALFQQQINDLMGQIHEKDKLIHQKIIQLQQCQQKFKIIQQLQAENNKLHQEYQIVLIQNQQLSQKIKQLNTQIINNSIKLKQHPNQQLLTKLKINQDWIKSLNQQNYNLKQKLLQDQYNKQKQKCSQTIFKSLNPFNTNNKQHSNLKVTNEILVKEFAKQAQKKVKKLDEEKQKLYFKYTKLKNSYAQLLEQNHQNQKHLNLLKVKINGYQQLTQKQQAQIQRMIHDFNKQIQRINSKNKQKNKNKDSIQEINSPSRFINIPLNLINSQISSIDNSPVRNMNKQKQLKTLIQNLQRQISQCQKQSQQKTKLIQFLQKKIQAIQQEKVILQTTNNQLEYELASYKFYDITKNNKNFAKDKQFIKTQNLTRNGSKIFIINGKTYESKLLKSNQNAQVQQSQRPINIMPQQRMQRSIQVSQQSEIINFPSNQISYITSKRNYQNQNINYMQRQ